jgi:hypothetical protein
METSREVAPRMSEEETKNGDLLQEPIAAPDFLSRLHQGHAQVLEKILYSLPLDTIRACRRVSPGTNVINTL